MKKMIMKFMSVFMAVFIICFVSIVPVSAENLYTDEQIKLSVNFSDLFNNYLENKTDWTSKQIEIIDSCNYFVKIICPGSSDDKISSYYCLYLLFSDIPEYDDSKHCFVFDSTVKAYYMRVTIRTSDSSCSCSDFSSFGSGNGVIDFYDYEDKYYVSRLYSFCGLSLNTSVYPVLYFDNFSDSKKDVDIKVNVDNISDTLPTSINLVENLDFYIDVKNNTEKAIQFIAWISDTPASSGAYNSYSRLNWTYSTQQWVYLYHGTWSGVDVARKVLDIYGNVIDTADLVGFCWWKDYLVDKVDDSLPKAYYSRENISSPYHFVSPGGDKNPLSRFNEKFSFNTATISKDKEYYFNVAYRQVINYEIIDNSIVLLNSAFHDSFEDLNYYELGYCTAFSLNTDTTPDNSTSDDTNVKFPSQFDNVINNTKNPSATIDADGNINLSGGNNDLNNSINFNPSISNSNYNGGVTINNNVGSNGSGGSSVDYGDFDGDTSKLNKLLLTCTNFFGFLKSGLTAFMPSNSDIFAILFSSGLLIIIFCRALGR